VLAVFIFCAVTAVVSAAPTCNLTKIEPSNLEANSTGTFIAVINCSDTNGEINTSRFLMTKTVEGFTQTGLPNFWSIRPPVNDIAESNATIPIPQILRAYNRGVGGWYDFYGLFRGNFSYGVHDNTSLHVTMTSGTGWAGTIEKTSDLSTRRSQRAQSLSVFQTPLGSSNVSAFSACSAVKLGGIVISLEKSIVPLGGIELHLESRTNGIPELYFSEPETTGNRKEERI